MSNILPLSSTLPPAVQLRNVLATGGLYVNGQRVTDGETFSPTLHVLPGNLSVFRVGKKTHHLLHWR